jgi:hypothetical protein
MRIVLALAGVAALTVAGCAQLTADRSAVTGDTLAISATVESVDQKTREMVLVGPDGGRVGFVAGPEVRNLNEVAPGDVVTVAYHDSVVLSMAAPDATQGTVVGAARAPKGAMPAGAAVIATDAVVTVMSYDAKSGFATFRTDDGVTHRATVPPELRTFAERTAPGSRVQISTTEAVAVAVTEG